MEDNDFSEIYTQNELLYYSNKKDTSKATISDFIQHLASDDMKCLMKTFEKHKSWKEYDYYMYLKLLQCSDEDADVNIALVHVLHALKMNIKEIVIIAMNIMRHFGSKIHLDLFIQLYFLIQECKIPEMSFYGYLLPTIKTAYGDDGLIILQENCTKILYNLHINWKVSQRKTLSNFIHSEMLKLTNFSVYEDTELVGLLFEVICKRREKVLAYESAEIDLILNNLSGIDAPEINYFKYFLSHLCITCNREKKVTSELFILIQNKCMLLLAENDVLKVKRGVRIYTDFYNCIVKSQYKTMYTLMPCDKHLARESPTFLLLQSSGCLTISEDLRFLVALINDANFHLFEEILTLHDCEKVLSKEQVLSFYHNLQDDYLEDKIDGLLRLLVLNWYKHQESRAEFVLELLEDFVHMDVKKETFDFNLYRLLKILGCLVSDFSGEQGEIVGGKLMKIVDFIVAGKYLKEVKAKIFERIIVTALDLLVQLSTNNQQLTEDKLHNILNYLEKGIFCNKKYAASATGFLYRKFIKSQYSTHKLVLDTYLRDVLTNTHAFDRNVSTLRRCLEKRILIHEFCLALSGNDQKDVARNICNYITTQEFVISQDLEAGEKDLKVYIFCVNAFIGDAALKLVTNEFVLPLLRFCLFAVDFHSKDFAICNAIYTLYSTLVQRILPYHDNTKNMTLESLLQLEPEISTRFKQIFTDSEHKRSSTLLLLLLQRTNNETPLDLPKKQTQEVVNQLWTYFSRGNPRKLCGFEVDSAIKLWVNLIPLQNVEKQMEIVQNMRLTTQKQCLNSRNVKFKLLEGLARKVNTLKQRNCIENSLKHNILYRNNCKMRICLPESLQRFPLKELTIKQGLRKILSKNVTIYERITAFEFFFDYFRQKDRLDVFINKFLMLYIKCLLFECFNYGKRLEAFSMSLNTIVFCLDCCRFNQTTIFGSNKLLNNVSSDKLSEKPSLLAFLTILSTKTRNTDEVCVLQQHLVNGYQEIAGNIDKHEQDEVESLLIAFKYMKYFKIEISVKRQQETLKMDLFLIATKFLQSVILSECDYLVAYILDGLNIDYCNIYLNASHVRRFLLSKMFLDCYFCCKKSKIVACLKYLHWFDVKSK